MNGSFPELLPVGKIQERLFQIFPEGTPNRGYCTREIAVVRDQRIVVDSVDEQLAHQPLLETRNRKPMRPNPMAPWELRIGDLRVYYEVKGEPDLLVTVLAVGIKERSVVRIGGEEVNL